MKERGFTLVELCITITLIGVLFATSSLLLSSGLKSYEHIHARSDISGRARNALERIVREVRGTGNVLQAINSNSVTFVDGQNLNAVFSYDNVANTLSRNADTLLENVTDFTFTGYDQNNNQTNVAADVWRVNIVLSALPENEDAELVLNTNVYLRNLMYENFQ